MVGKYATTTSVSVSKTRSDIEDTLSKYGADTFAYATEPTRAVVMFVLDGRRIRFDLPMPDQRDKAFTHYKRGTYGDLTPRTDTAARELWEQACRSSWRSLFLVIKANLEAVAAGIVTAHQAFLPYTIMPSGRTVAEEAEPAVTEAYRSGLMPTSFLALGPGR